MSKIFKEYKGCFITLFCGAGFWIAFLLLRQSPPVMNFVVDCITTPAKRGISFVVCLLPFSVMELCVAAAVVTAAVIIIRGLLLIKKRGAQPIIKAILILLCGALLVYDGFCLSWGINYYADSFTVKSGISAKPVSADELYITAKYYAELANENAAVVLRDENGDFSVSREDIFNEAERLYDNIGKRWTFLQTPWRMPKKVLFSKFMSAMNFTGVYFPFLGESNLNIDFPPVLLPATIAHELAHQKNIAPEQEANFIAVMAATAADSEVYKYSGALLAYVHLGNALYKADYDLWQEIYVSLSDEVRHDLEQNNAYWNSFKGKTAEAAEALYTGFLQSYGQSMGMQSYGACVDLLVAEHMESIK